MSKNNAFANAVETSVLDIERGSVILYKPLKSNEIERGIVYDIILRNDGSNHPSGFTILPIETVDKRINPKRPYPFIQKEDKRIVKEAGGNPGWHKTITQIHLQTVVNIGVMTGSKDMNTIRVIGSYSDSPFLEELMKEVEQSYKNGTLHKDKKLVEPTTVIRIVPPWVAKSAALENSSLRRKAYQELREESEKTGTPVGPIIQESLAAKQQEEELKHAAEAKRLEEAAKKAAEEKRQQEAAAELIRKKEERARKAAETRRNNKEKAKNTVANMDLGNAFEAGLISERTLSFLKDAVVPSTGKAPDTLSHAFELVQNPKSLKAVYGLGNGGSTYQNIVNEVSAATAILKPKTP